MFFDRILDLIFPPPCLSCKANVGGEETICRRCFGGIVLNQTLFCGRCSARLPDQKKICHADYPYILGAATEYNNEAARSLIKGLKFQFAKKAARPLGELLARYTESLELPLKGFITIPIPLSQKRLRQRGFNQSELIAGIFADHFSLPLESHCLVKPKNTKPQSETKGLDERKENIKNCFRVENAEKIVGKKIILIDDVTTSGATLFEAAKTLKTAGAKKIIALTVARA